ncbi:hypothetical protein B0H14DRAFT_2591091 [Mycena olivaceomarginata]|nr:hypothetical protein B0H14DRAFT_2591091 [Mycena olivaceomarginata]
MPPFFLSPTTTCRRCAKPRRHRFLAFSVLLAVSVVGIFFLSPHPVAFTRTAARDSQRLPIGCPTQHSALAPAMPFSLSHKENVYMKRLQGAVQIRTETFVVRRAAPRRRRGMIREIRKFKARTLCDARTAASWQGSDESLAPTMHARPQAILRLSMGGIALDLAGKSFVAAWTKVEADGGLLWPGAGCAGDASCKLMMGSVNIKVSVNVPGVDSSVPTYSPPHTAVDILSTLIAAIEAHPPLVS